MVVFLCSILPKTPERPDCFNLNEELLSVAADVCRCGGHRRCHHSSEYIARSEERGARSRTRRLSVDISPFQLPTDRFYIRFYLIAMLFILFDIEVVFLFPWAVVFKTLSWSGFWSILIFIFVLGAGYVYAWRKGAFQWE